MRQHYDVIVLGGGAAGLMCAAEAGRRGRAVLVLEHAAQVGNKILVSGGGQCNFTNLHTTPQHYLSQNPHFCKSVLARFTPADFVRLIVKHGIAFHEKTAGQLFCNAGSKQIVGMLLKECSEAGAEIRVNCPVLGVEKSSGYKVVTPDGRFDSDAVVVATGGLSYPKIGATDLGFRLARQFGLKAVPTRPALVPLTFGETDRHWGDLAGASVEAVVECHRHRFRGAVLFTHRGLSGPAILQASSYWSPGDSITIALSPETDLSAVMRENAGSRMELRTLLAQHLPKRFADRWCAQTGLSKRVNQCPARELEQAAEALRVWTLFPAGTEGYARAEVTRGGVDTRELSSKTLEARNVPGLYFVGEVTDVTGELGGYNLHWAWASGFAAGQYA